MAVPEVHHPNSFRTLERERAFINPSTSAHQYPAPQALVAPHIDSFDALFHGAPIGPTGAISASQGLLDLAVQDLQPKVIFDGTGADGARGNRLESESLLLPRMVYEECADGELQCGSTT